MVKFQDMIELTTISVYGAGRLLHDQIIQTHISCFFISHSSRKLSIIASNKKILRPLSNGIVLAKTLEKNNSLKESTKP